MKQEPNVFQDDAGKYGVMHGCVTLGITYLITGLETRDEAVRFMEVARKGYSCAQVDMTRDMYVLYNRVKEGKALI